MQQKWVLLTGTALSLSALPATAAPLTCGFLNFSPTGNAEDASAQMCLDIADQGNGQVLFQFTNDDGAHTAGPILPSVITQVHFDDNLGLLADMSIAGAPATSASGVQFRTGGSPANLAQAADLTPAFSSDHRATRRTGDIHENGVDPGEMLGILFSGHRDDILDALIHSTLRIGIRVQLIGAGGDSDSYLVDANKIPRPCTGPSCGSQPVPEPATIVLLGTSLFGLAGYGWQRRRTPV